MQVGNARVSRPHALLQTAPVVMTRLFVWATPLKVQATVVVFEVMVNLVILFLRVVICPLNILRAEPANCLQTPFGLRKLKWVVVRVEPWNIHEAARQTGMVWVLAVGLGRLRLMRSRRALKRNPPALTAARTPGEQIALYLDAVKTEWQVGVDNDIDQGTPHYNRGRQVSHPSLPDKTDRTLVKSPYVSTKASYLTRITPVFTKVRNTSTSTPGISTSFTHSILRGADCRKEHVG